MVRVSNDFDSKNGRIGLNLTVPLEGLPSRESTFGKGSSMRKMLGSLTLACLLAIPGTKVVLCQSDQSVKDDVKDAGHATKKAAKKTAKKTKKETKKAVNKSAEATEKGADKVKEKTKP
jgi:hypothetical protein